MELMWEVCGFVAGLGVARNVVNVCEENYLVCMCTHVCVCVCVLTSLILLKCLAYCILQSMEEIASLA